MKVSVIIPSWNRAALLERAVKSVQRQVLGGAVGAVQLIVVDDGSEDDTQERIKQMRAEDKQLEYIRIPHTGMPGAVRNAGLAYAAGDVIAFLDSDDVWLAGKLEQQTERLGAAGFPHLVHCREHWYRKSGDKLQTISQKSQQHQREGEVFASALHKCMIGPSTVLLPREGIQQLQADLGGKLFREDIPVAEDYELWLHWTARWPVTYVDVPLVEKWAGHGDQLSEQWGVIEYFRLRCLLDFADMPVELPRIAGLPSLPPNETRAARNLLPEKQELMRRMLQKKLSVFAQGAAKRNNPEAAIWAEGQASRL